MSVVVTAKVDLDLIVYLHVASSAGDIVLDLRNTLECGAARKTLLPCQPSQIDSGRKIYIVTI